MKKTLKQFFILICLVVLLILPYFVFAASPLSKLKDVAEGGGYEEVNETSFASILGSVVNAFLSLLGIIFIVLTVYAGYRWMTAGGNEEKVTKAKETLWRSIIGLIIVVGAYAIYNFIFIRLF